MESEVSETPLIYKSTSIPSLPEKTLDHESPSPSTSPKKSESGFLDSPSIWASSSSSSSSSDKTLDYEEEEEETTHQSESTLIYPPEDDDNNNALDRSNEEEEEPLQSLTPLSFQKQMELERRHPPFYSAYSSPPRLFNQNPLDDDDDDDLEEAALTSPSPPRYRYFSDTMPSFFPEFSYFDEGNNKPSNMGAGLSNMGNTCFLNSILQCFTHTVPLLESLRSYNHHVPCFRNIEGFCVICTLRQHVDYSLRSSGRVISPYKFVDNLSNISSSFRRFEQEDAHEFLQCLLDRLDICCLDQNKQFSSSSSQEDSFVKKIFGGRLKSQLRCCNCGHCSDTFEPLIDLSLEIEDVETLPDALRSFTKVEKIEDPETKFTCEKCEQEVLLEKQFTLDQAPSVATFHLKRFKNDGRYVEKIDKHVEYPLELDLQPYTNGSENIDVKLKYELYAVVVHVGFTNSSGHYFCYIRSAPETWHRLDDSRVVKVSERHVLSQEAYILFYAREDTPWFSDFMEARSQCMGQSSETTSPTSVLHDFNKFCPLPLEEKTKPTGDVEVHDVYMERITSPYFPKKRISSPPPQIDILSDVVEDDVVIKECPKTPPTRSSSPDYIRECPKTPPPKPSSPDYIREFPKTPPPRSASPDDIYTDEPPGVSYHPIPRDHLKLKGGNGSTRSANDKGLEDRRWAAIRLTRSMMPASRASKYRAYISGSPNSEKSSKRKKRKPGMSYDRESSPLRSLRRAVGFR